MAHTINTIALLQVFILMSVCYGSGPTNTRSDRISQAIIASEDAIGKAVAGDRTSVRMATEQGMAFAKLATRDGAKPSDFGRRLTSGATNNRADRIAQALSASTDAISSAVAGKTNVKVAILKSKDFAKLATRDGSKPSDFGRRLLSGATNNRADRIAQALSASTDAISSAVSGKTDVKVAILKSQAFAKLATRDGAKPSDFGRRLLSGATNNRADRIAQALSASTDAISSAVAGKTNVRVAVTKSKDFAKLATRDGAKPSDFGRKLMSGSTNNRSDRIAQALSSSTDAISSAVAGNTNVGAATAQGKAYSMLATHEGAHPSDFGK